MTLPMQTRRSRGGGRRAGAEVHAVPTLPPWKAFVVQLTGDTTSHAGIFAGRVEHMSSGRRQRFNSREELLATLLRLLEEAEHGGSA
jgi:hypothetical protein